MQQNKSQYNTKQQNQSQDNTRHQNKKQYDTDPQLYYKRDGFIDERNWKFFKRYRKGVKIRSITVRILLLIIPLFVIIMGGAFFSFEDLGFLSILFSLSCIIFFSMCMYHIFWFGYLNDDSNFLAQERYPTSSGVEYLLGMFTAGIYFCFWAYKQGERIERAYEIRGINVPQRRVIYTVTIIFLPIISYCLMQNDINHLVRFDNSKAENNSGKAIQ